MILYRKMYNTDPRYVISVIYANENLYRRHAKNGSVARSRIHDAVGWIARMPMDSRAGRLAAILSHPKVEQPVSATAWLCQITKVSKGAKASRGNTRERQGVSRQATRREKCKRHDERNSFSQLCSQQFSIVCRKWECNHSEGIFTSTFIKKIWMRKQYR